MMNGGMMWTMGASLAAGVRLAGPVDCSAREVSLLRQ